MKTILLSLVSISCFAQFNCGELLIDERDNQAYETAQIGDQCWMAENLNIGIMKESFHIYADHSDVTDNNIIEKYCYDNKDSNCIENGGLYDYNEMMNYEDTVSPFEKYQGICPDGWLIPSVFDFKELEGNCPIDAGTELKTGVFNGGQYVGIRTSFGTFDFAGNIDQYYMTKDITFSHIRSIQLNRTDPAIIQSSSVKTERGYSVRCILDDYTGIKEVQKSETLIYPNPVTDYVNIVAEGNITIVDLIGNVIYKGESGRIDLSYCSPGIYFVNNIKLIKI